MNKTEANYLTDNTYTPEPRGWFWRNDDYCDCDRCPCCGKLRRRRFNFDKVWCSDGTTTNTTGDINGRKSN